MLKLSFLGDIMCEGPFLEAAARENETYDFSDMLSGLKELLKKSDFVLANLETPLAGKEAGYTKTRDLYSFNTPDSFADAVKAAGISFVLTANNHCCDRGMEGLERTIKVLDAKGIRHTGTHTIMKNNVPEIVGLGTTKIAIIACTDSTNASRNKCKPTLNNVNLLKEQFTTVKTGKKVAIKTFIVRHIVGEQNYMRIRKCLGYPPKKVSIDNVLDVELMQQYLDNIEKQIKWAKENADLVLVCPHMGGQFNVTPGKFSEYVVQKLVDFGADAVIASHPHIIQKAEIKRGVPCIFSLGNVSMSMTTMYIIRDELPDYGMILHLYIDDNQIVRMTYSLIIMIEDQKSYLKVRTLREEYLRSDNLKKRVILENAERIVRRICQDNTLHITDIPEEFELVKGVEK